MTVPLARYWPNEFNVQFDTLPLLCMLCRLTASVRLTGFGTIVSPENVAVVAVSAVAATVLGVVFPIGGGDARFPGARFNSSEPSTGGSFPPEVICTKLFGPLKMVPEIREFVSEFGPVASGKNPLT